MSPIKKLFYASLISSLIPFLLSLFFGFNSQFLAILDSINLSLCVFALSIFLLSLFGRIALAILLMIQIIIFIFLKVSFEYYQHFGGFIEYEAIALFGELLIAAKNFVSPWLLFLGLLSLISISFFYRNAVSYLKPVPLYQVAILCGSALAIAAVNQIHLKSQIHLLNPLGISIIDREYYQKQNPLLYFVRSTPMFEPLEKRNNKDLQEYALASAVLSNAVDTLPEPYHYSKFPDFILPYKGFEHLPSNLNPFKYKPNALNTNEQGNRKNVILIVLESFRAWETTLMIGDIELTANYNRIAKQSIKLSNAYSTSNYTVMSEQAILCGVYDINNPVPYATLYGKINKPCLPKMLLDRGYETSWFHGNEKAFYNRDVFHPSIGFKHIFDSEYFDQLNLNEEHYIGWGVNDETVFKHALQVLNNTSKPFMAEILTLSNHLPFNWDFHEFVFPKQLIDLGDNELALYHRSVYYADYALGQFFDAFKRSPLAENTILVITGDHGAKVFPDDLGDAEKNELFYRTPMLIYEHTLTPRVIETQLSHLDIAPTILALLDINIEQSFLGRPFLGDNAEEIQRPIFYTGTNEYGVKVGTTLCHSSADYCSNSKSACYKIEQMSCKNWDPATKPWLEQLPYFINFISLNKRTGYYSGE
ncbi:LTA synthase family protein [Thalassotalea litorea]|uniref:LTA synthase family protein n=1 Tax=Thalassotalea litorea TaxID=2020715 RepID=UPI003735FE50